MMQVYLLVATGTIGRAIPIRRAIDRAAILKAVCRANHRGAPFFAAVAGREGGEQGE